MKYLSEEYMMKHINKHCEDKTCYIDCELFEFCRHNFKRIEIREEAFAFLALDLLLVDDEEEE